MISLPDWTPEYVRPLLLEMDVHPACSGARRVAFEQVVHDERMKLVYDQFLRRNRQTGAFLHPAKKQASDQSADQAQQAAIREVLRLTVSAAGDRMSVSKLEQLEMARQQWGDISLQFRGLAHDMELASERGLLGLDDHSSQNLVAGDIQAMHRVANWVDHLASSMRQPDDPLIVARDRGDPIERGVRILIGITLEEQFGQRLEGTAATLTSVALSGAPMSARRDPT
jgi:hypothetical protein